MIKQAIILAGGLGTRLRPITDTIPKPMIPFHGKPFVEYLVDLLIEQGIEEIVLILGYLAEQVVNHFGNGDKFGIKISYSISSVEDDTGLRITKAKHLMHDEFLLLYCDNYWPLNLSLMYSKYKAAGVDAMVTIYSNKDSYTKNNCIVDEDSFLVAYDKTRTLAGLKGVDIGFFLMKKKVINMVPEGNVNFEREVIPQLLKSRNLLAFKTDHRYYSVGSHERLILTDQFLARKPTIIIDRDGVLNKKAPKADYVKKWSEWEWLPGSKEAICLLKKNNYQIVVVTNQAGIARGKMTEEDLTNIHIHMQDDLISGGGEVDKIYHCPHGWDDNCECRKPKPGMLYQAQRDFHLDLSRTYFIGDDERDMIAGKAAGMNTVLVTDNYTLLNFVKRII